jgi:hypothetical protein
MSAKDNPVPLLKEAGWFNRQLDIVQRSVASWPEWMRRAANIKEAPKSDG